MYNEPVSESIGATPEQVQATLIVTVIPATTPPTGKSYFLKDQYDFLCLGSCKPLEEEVAVIFSTEGNLTGEVECEDK